MSGGWVGGWVVARGQKMTTKIAYAPRDLTRGGMRRVRHEEGRPGVFLIAPGVMRFHVHEASARIVGREAAI